MRPALPLLAFLLIAGFVPRAGAQVALPEFEALVTDLTGTLTAQQQAELDTKLTQFQARKGAQIAVLMLPSTAPEDIAQFGIRLADHWRVGRAQPDDGVIFIVAKDDRAMRIEVGRGLEGALTDALSSRIINETVGPLFKQGDFYGGINAGLDQMIRVVDGEVLPPPDPTWKSKDGPPTNIGFLAIVVWVLGNILRGFLGRFGAATVAGAMGGLLLWVATGLLVAGIVGGVVIFVLVLLTGGRRGSGGGRGSRGSGPGGRPHVYRDKGGGGFGGMGGGGFGGGFGGGGFGGGGGFSGGGGGSFGGGGASGRW